MFVQEQICEHIFMPNGSYCVYFSSNIFRNPRGLESFASFAGFESFPSFSWGIFGHVTRLDQSRASENI